MKRNRSPTTRPDNHTVAKWNRLSYRTSGTVASPPQMMDIWQWHETLVETEAARRLSVKKKLEHNAQEYTAIHQLVADALQETATAR